MKRVPSAVVVSWLIALGLLIAAFGSNVASAQKPSTTIVVSANVMTLRGVVIDTLGAVVSNARIQVIDSNGDPVVETFSHPDGTFEITSPVEAVTLSAYAQGVGRFRKVLNLKSSATEKLEVKLTMECSADIKRVIPKKLDLRHFLLEIHHYGAFGDCPEKAYRLWGTGEASVTYSACGGKRFQDSRFIEAAVLSSALAELAKEQSMPVCDYYAGGIDAPRVELTIFSGSEPRLVISHDEGADIQSLSELERKLETLIDPDGRMRSFRAKEKRSTGR